MYITVTIYDYMSVNESEDSTSFGTSATIPHLVSITLTDPEN